MTEFSAPGVSLKRAAVIVKVLMVILSELTVLSHRTLIAEAGKPVRHGGRSQFVGMYPNIFPERAWQSG